VYIKSPTDLYVCVLVTGKLQIDSSFSFLDGIDPFLAVISPCGTIQNVVLRFFFI